jgi:hypothetical protein
MTRGTFPSDVFAIRQRQGVIETRKWKIEEEMIHLCSL